MAKSYFPQIYSQNLLKYFAIIVKKKNNAMRDKNSRGETSYCHLQSLKNRAEMIPRRESFSTRGYYSVCLYRMH